jgi:spoIIIJ-associated protein
MARATKKVDAKKVLEDTTGELFKLLLVKSKATVEEDKKNEALVVNIQADNESGLLIGSRGRTLQSLQTVLGLMLRQRLGEWKRVIVDVADWREKEEERLKDLAEKTAERALSTGEPQNLYNLTPSQRRIVHMTLSKNLKVKTESQGEGNDRFLVISSKK